jgi:hypothetical protein
LVIRQFAEVLVVRHQDARVGDGHLQDFVVGCAWASIPDRDNITSEGYPTLRRAPDRCSRSEAVSLRAHQWNDAFRLDQFLRVQQTGANIVGIKAVSLGDLVDGKAVRRQADDELDGNSRPFDDRFADKNVWLRSNAVLPIHGPLL